MRYQFCPHCGSVHHRISRVCSECGYPTIISDKNVQALAQLFSDSDFNILAATSTISGTDATSRKSVRLSLEFRECYDIDKVFVDLPTGWSAYHTFSLHDAIITDNITELNCSFEYHYMGFCSVDDEIQTEIDRMMDWLSDINIAILRLAGFWL